MVSKKTSFVVLVLVLISFSLYSESLEEIWNIYRTNNTEIKQLENSLELAKFKEENDKDNGGTPYLSFGGNVNFPKTYEDGHRFTPLSFDENITLNKNISSGTKIGLSIKNSMTNNYKYVDADIYSQTTSVGVTVDRSLCPYWLQADRESKGDPYQKILSVLTNEARYKKEVTEKACLESIANYYIQARYYMRLIELTRKTIAAYDEIISLIDDMGENLTIEMLNRNNEYRNSRWEYAQNLKDYVSSLATIKSKLEIYCGQNIDIDLNDSLPDENRKMFPADPKWLELDSKISLVKLQRALEIQGTSPQLSIGAGVAMSNVIRSFDDYLDGFSDEDAYNWYLSFSFDLSSFASSKSRVNKKAYEVDLKDLEELQREYNVQKKANVHYFEMLILEAEDRKGKAEEIFEIYKKRFQQISELFEKNAISEIELLFCKMYMLQMQNALDSSVDEIWLYKWQKNNG